MFFEKEYAVGRVRAMRAKLMPESALSEMMSEKSVSGVILSLAGTPYEHAFAKRNLVHNERALSMHTAAVARRVLDFLPKEYYDLLSMFSLEADAKNLKICVRGLAEGIAWNKIRRGLAALGAVYEKTEKEDVRDFEALLSAMSGTGWHEVLRSGSVYFEEKDITRLEHEIDKHFFAHAEEFSSGSIQRFFLEKKELCDFRILSLAEDIGVPAPGDLLFAPHLSGNITKKYAHLRQGSLERNIQNHLLSLSRELMLLEPFSHGLFIDFFCRTENEARVIARAARHISSKIQNDAGVPE